MGYVDNTLRHWIYHTPSSYHIIVHPCSIIQEACIACCLKLLTVKLLLVGRKLCIGRVGVLASEWIVVISLYYIAAVVGYYPCTAQMVGDVVVRKDGVVGVDEPSPAECSTLKCPYRAAPVVYQRTKIIVPVGGVVYNSKLGAVCKPCVRCHCCTILTNRLLQVKNIIGNCQLFRRTLAQITFLFCGNRRIPIA